MWFFFFYCLLIEFLPRSRFKMFLHTYSIFFFFFLISFLFLFQVLPHSIPIGCMRKRHIALLWLVQFWRSHQSPVTGVLMSIYFYITCSALWIGSFVWLLPSVCFTIKRFKTFLYILFCFFKMETRSISAHRLKKKKNEEALNDSDPCWPQQQRGRCKNF